MGAHKKKPAKEPKQPRVDPQPDKGKDDAAPGHNKPAEEPAPAPVHGPGKFGGNI
jgi:hypothetical protein